MGFSYLRRFVFWGLRTLPLQRAWLGSCTFVGIFIAWVGIGIRRGCFLPTFLPGFFFPSRWGYTQFDLRHPWHPLMGDVRSIPCASFRFSRVCMAPDGNSKSVSKRDSYCTGDCSNSFLAIALDGYCCSIHPGAKGSLSRLHRCKWARRGTLPTSISAPFDQPGRVDNTSSFVGSLFGVAMAGSKG